MLTPTLGGVNVGHHHARKVYVTPGRQLFAWAGDIGLAMRLRTVIEFQAPTFEQNAIPLDVGLKVSTAFVASCNATKVNLATQVVNGVLAFNNGEHHCCVFEGTVQPRMLDPDHYYAVLGTGKLSADPFLRFLVDIFCRGGRPNVQEAVFLATWTIEHVIATNPGGVAGPIRTCVLEREGAIYRTRELADEEIDEHRQAVKSAESALREWRDKIQSGAAADEAEPIPEAGAPPQ
jgi:hypothetical protein